ELVVRCGRPANVVGEEAANAGLIVIGPHESVPLSDALRGTFTEKLLSEARCPVLVVRKPANEPYRSVLLAVDGSPATGHVVRAAERLPVAEDAAFAAVHAHEPPYEAMMNTVGVGNVSVASYASASLSQAASLIHSQLRLHSRDWRRYRVILMDARPSPAIRQSMLETRPDLLVLGTRGHGRFRRALLGSTAHDVLTSVDCDVLLVPESMLRAKRRIEPVDDDPGPQAA
ncbi:MAG TPA: universal stress protein, partial [Steroidobacteraceae bacterium]